MFFMPSAVPSAVRKIVPIGTVLPFKRHGSQTLLKSAWSDLIQTFLSRNTEENLFFYI